jgi:hypothetical protein
MFRGGNPGLCHFSQPTLDLIKQVKEKFERNSSYSRKCHFVASKYLRKPAFDRMIELP